MPLLLSNICLWNICWGVLLSSYYEAFYLLIDCTFILILTVTLFVRNGVLYSLLLQTKTYMLHQLHSGPNWSCTDFAGLFCDTLILDHCKKHSKTPIHTSIQMQTIKQWGRIFWKLSSQMCDMRGIQVVPGWTQDFWKCEGQDHHITRLEASWEGVSVMSQHIGRPWSTFVFKFANKTIEIRNKYNIYESITNTSDILLHHFWLSKLM